LPSEIPYAIFANYSPRGSAKQSEKSRTLCGLVKAGRVDVIRSALPHLTDSQNQDLVSFLNPEITLVPVPRSAPLTAGALWPSKVIADTLLEGYLGREVLPCIRRVSAVRKSSTSPANERPLWTEHYASLVVDKPLFDPVTITLIDDVLTMGRTAYACAQRLKDTFPNAEVKFFALIRTQGLIPDIEKIVEPSIGTITGYSSGKTLRNP